MSDSQTSKPRIGYLILDKLIIVLIVAAGSLWFKYMYESAVNKVNTESAARLKEIDAIYAKFARREQNAQDILKDSLFKQNQLRVDERLTRLQNQLDLQKSVELSALKVREQMKQMGAQYGLDIKRLYAQDTLAARVRQTESNLQFISIQLSEFYWPIYYRLEKNNSLFGIMRNTFLGEKIDTAMVLKNHLEIISILEKKIYLAQPDTLLLAEIKKYLAHVSVYQAIREDNYKGFPERFGLDYPKRFFTIIKSRTEALQDKYNGLLNRDTIYHQFAYIKDTISKLQELRNFESSFNGFAVAPKTFTIKQSWNSRKYYVAIDDSVNIVFSDYIEDGKVCVFKFQLVTQKNGKKKYIDEFINMRKGDVDWKEIRNSNYQIKLEDVFITPENAGLGITKSRRRARIIIKKWMNNDAARL